MGIIQRQSIKGTLVFIVGSAIHFATMILFMPKLLSIQDQATYRVYLSIILTTSVLGIAGVNAVLIRHLETWRKNKLVLPTFNAITLGYTLLWSLIMVAGLYLGKDFIYKWKGTTDPYLLKYFWCIPLSSFFFALLYYFEAYSIATHRLTAPSIVKEVLLKLILLISMVLYAKQLITIYQFFLIYALSYGVGFIIMAIYCFTIRGYRLGWSNIAVQQLPLQDYFKYSIYFLLSSIAGALMLNSDQVVLYGMLGSTATAIYGNSVTLGSMITIPYKPLSAILLPFMYEAWANNDTEKLNKINLESSKNLSAIGALLLVLLVANVHHLYQFMPASLAFFKWPLIIIGLGRVLDYTTGASTELLLSSPTYKRLVVYMFATFIFSLLCYKILIPRYQEVGAALSCSLTLLFYNVLKYIHLYKQYKLQPFNLTSMAFILIGAIAWAAQLLLPVLPNFILDIAVRCTIIATVYGGIVLYYKLIPFANNLLTKYIIKK